MPHSALLATPRPPMATLSPMCTTTGMQTLTMPTSWLAWWQLSPRITRAFWNSVLARAASSRNYLSNALSTPTPSLVLIHLKPCWPLLAIDHFRRMWNLSAAIFLAHFPRARSMRSLWATTRSSTCQILRRCCHVSHLCQKDSPPLGSFMLML